MKLKIVNLHPGLRNPKTGIELPLNRQVLVDESAFWRRRAEQGHVELVAKMTDREAKESLQAEVAAAADEKRGKKPKRSPTRRKTTAKGEPDPTTTTDDSEG